MITEEQKPLSASESIVLIPQIKQLFLPLGHEVGVLTHNIMSPLCKTCGITLQQFYLLSELKGNPGMTISQMCSRSGVLLANFSVIFRKLERQNLVIKQRNAKDRRSSSLFLTPDGEALLDEIDAEWGHQMDSLLSRANPKELACVLEGLKTLKVLLERAR